MAKATHPCSICGRQTSNRVGRSLWACTRLHTRQELDARERERWEDMGMATEDMAWLERERDERYARLEVAS